MRTATLSCIASVLLLVGFPEIRDARAECVFLKNGALVTGSIIGETGSAITVKTSEGAHRVLERDQVLRILYTDIYLGKVVVRLTDGSVREAFMVDENAEFYTFRDRLDHPDEYTLPRKKVLFMARTNPTDLAGRAGATFIRVTWHPPYRRPKSYRLYIQERGSMKYTHAGTTRHPFYHLGDLKEKTWYRIIVTAVDGSGDESLPADELECMTNTPPDPPSRARLERLPLENGTVGARMTWRPPIDRDGTIVRYRIYARAGASRSEIGETTGTEFTARGLDPSVIHHFAIRALDNDGSESDDALLDTGGVEFDLNARACVILPVRRMGTILDKGYGGIVSFSVVDFPGWGLSLGPGAGYIHFHGKGGSVRNACMAPLFLGGNYRIMLTDALSIAPVIMAGLSFIRIAYSGKKPWIQGTVYSSRKGYEPFTTAGIILSYLAGKGILLQLGADYGVIFERRSHFEYVSCNAGLGLRI